MPGFMEKRLQTPIPGRIGPTADLYPMSLEGDGRELSTRYEY